MSRPLVDSIFNMGGRLHSPGLCWKCEQQLGAGHLRNVGRPDNPARAMCAWVRDRDEAAPPVRSSVFVSANVPSALTSPQVRQDSAQSLPVLTSCQKNLFLKGVFIIYINEALEYPEYA